MNRLLTNLIYLGFAGTLFAFSVSNERINTNPVVAIDLAKVFKSLDENNAYELKLKSMFEKNQIEEELRKEKFEKMIADYEATVGEAKKDLREKIDLYRMESDAWARFALRERDLEQSLILEDKFIKTKEAVSSLAESNGWKVVLFDDSGLSFSYDDSSKASRSIQFQSQIMNRKILWNDQSVDVSDLVIDRMNNEYASKGMDS